MTYGIVVSGQLCSKYDRECTIASDSIEFVDVVFRLPSDWASLQCVAQFAQGNKCYDKVLVDGKCKLPSEIQVGEFRVSVFGYEAGQAVRGTTIPLVDTIVQSGFCSNGETSVPPTPDLYAQLLDKINQTESTTGEYADAAKQSADAAKGSENAAASSAKESEASATKSAESAEEAKKAKDETVVELGKVQDAGAAAVSEIGQAKTKAIQDVQQAGTESVDAVGQAKTEALSDMQGLSNTLVSSINAAGKDVLDGIAAGKEQALQDIEASKTSALEDVKNEGATQTKVVEDEGIKQTKAVTDAGNAKLEEINKVNALIPAPSEADAGKVPVAQSDGTYALQEVTVDAYTKLESDARYAPIEAAIKVSGKGTGLVNLSPTVAWRMQGLKVFGKSQQFTTTGAQLIPFELGEKISAANSYSSILPTEAAFVISRETVSGTLNNDIYFVGGIRSDLESDYSEYENLPEGSYYIYCNSAYATLYVVVWRNGASQILGSSSNSKSAAFSVKSGDKFRIFFRINISESSPKEEKVLAIIRKAENGPNYEPYTGGMPSPNPEYPQEIVSTGDDGQIDVNLTNCAFDLPSFDAENTGSSTGFVWAILSFRDAFKALPNGTFFIKYEVLGSGTPGSNMGKIRIDGASGTLVEATNVIIMTDDLRNKITQIVLYGYVSQVCTFTNFVIVEGDTDISQLLLIPTPGGLPGIPVDSGGNYTDETGQQWICDYVDFVRGVKVQNIALYKASDLVFYKDFYYANDGSIIHRFSTMPNQELKTNAKGFSNLFTWARVNPIIGTSFRTNENKIRVFLNESVETAEQANQLLLDKNTEFLIQLTTPIETPLSSEELATYADITSYDDATNILSDEEVGLEASALAEPNKWIDEKIKEAVSQAVAKSIVLTAES